jgi:hypothetical protein
VTRRGRRPAPRRPGESASTRVLRDQGTRPRGSIKPSLVCRNRAFHARSVGPPNRTVREQRVAPPPRPLATARPCAHKRGAPADRSTGASLTTEPLVPRDSGYWLLMWDGMRTILCFGRLMGPAPPTPVHRGRSATLAHLPPAHCRLLHESSNLPTDRKVVAGTDIRASLPGGLAVLPRDCSLTPG